jgi:hypothetical protein
MITCCSGGWSQRRSRRRYFHPRHGCRWKARSSRLGPGTRDEEGKLHPLDVKSGNRVLFGKWSGTEVKLDGEDLMIMKEADIMGIVEGGAAVAKTS